ncbi:MAG TPA: SRPBCC domain-containing protein [Anaerolineae bacterium]|nr:SRPBCC domain-containing protein [Anaerolineae bacterium]
MSTEPKKRDLTVTRVFDAPVEQVWKAWVEPEMVMQWWGPEGFTCPLAEMDFREGGTSLVCMRAPKEFGGQDLYNTWTYKKIVPMQSIEYILNFADKDGNKADRALHGLPPDAPQEVRNLVTFKTLAGGKTEMTVTEFDWVVGPIMELSKAGLEQCLDKMAAIFAK